jgi:hypothetical protein
LGKQQRRSRSKLSPSLYWDEADRVEPRLSSLRHYKLPKQLPANVEIMMYLPMKLLLDFRLRYKSSNLSWRRQGRKLKELRRNGKSLKSI